MVSIMMIIGIRNVGVPCGRRWASEILVLYRKPRITVPVHRGIAMLKFTVSCVVGANE